MVKAKEGEAPHRIHENAKVLAEEIILKLQAVPAEEAYDVVSLLRRKLDALHGVGAAAAKK
jgi:hypothetical protein